MKAGGRGSADKQKGTSMYADDKYKIVGTISIPEEKREEFNRNVEKVLDQADGKANGRGQGDHGVKKAGGR